ncbi:THAP domain-containing protein 3 isoform X1 [Oncorhynchus clarkii lewisi]|uniref:THAP domain-containing protein 3 isoform X1 n=1 Tax=Oncorhynchus clarkii lewisi TaxID=490388 RepID=UPI0039B96028
MPRECAVKTCDNKQKTWSALMFHRLPLSHPDRLKLWLIALNKDANTATDDLRKLLVCSEHFLPGDYYEKLGQDRHSRMRIMKSFLKDTAVPSVAVHAPGQRGIISVETGDVPPGTDSLSAGGASGPTPQGGGSGVATATTGFLSHRGLELTEPASTSGTYVALAPTCSLSKDLPSTTTTGDACRRKKTKTNVPVTRRKKGQMDAAVKTTSVKDCTSMSSAAGSTSSPSTSSPSTSSHSSNSDSRVSSGEPNGEPDGGGVWSERKWIVNESKLKELFQTCHQCGAALRNRTITALGYSQIKVTWTCPDEHRGEWQSCPDAFGIGHYLQTVGYRVLLDSMNSQFVSHD